MKKLISVIILVLTSYLIFSMEEKPGETKEDIFSKLAPELQVYFIEQGIVSRLDSDQNSIEAILDALKYLYVMTSLNAFLYSYRNGLENRLKKLAKEKFASEYTNLSKEELNQELDKAMYELSNSGVHIRGQPNSSYYDIRNKIFSNNSPERNKVVKLILAGADANFEGRHLFSGSGKEGLLQQIIGFEDIGLIRLLIAYGADVNRKDLNSLTPLDKTIYGDYRHLDMDKIKKIIELLTKHGVNINARNENGLNIAIKRALHFPEVLKLLLDFGVKLETTDIKAIKSLRLTPKESIDVLKNYGYEI